MGRSLTIVCGFSLLLTACPGDDAGGTGETGSDLTDGMTSTGSESGSGSGSMSSSMTMTSTPGTEESSGGPACDSTDQATIDMCIAGAMEEDDYCVEVGDCNCMSCACELGACSADAGCSAIRECAQMTGCLGLDCLEPENCMMVIEDAGGVAGPSGMIALALSGCVEGAGCATQCPGESTGSSGGEGSSSGTMGG
jgi:hypothetical protein